MKSKDLALYKQRQQLYRKVGRKYIPVNDPWAYDGLRDGHWHVWVRPGMTTMRTPVWPDRMEVEAALLELESQLVELISAASAAEPKNRPLTPRQKELWDELMKTGDFHCLTYPSMQGIADKILENIRNKLK